jgi:hypothetical protein
MSGRNLTPAWFANGLGDWRIHVERCNIYPVRAAGRAVIAAILAGLPIAAVLDLPHDSPGVERTTDVAIAIISTIALLFALRRFGQGRGVLWGFWLSLLSWIWFQGVVAAAYTVWLATGLNGEPTIWSEVYIGAAMSIVLLVPCTLRLRSIDPDF